MSAWKACDLRGRYPDEVNADLLRSVARRIGATLPGDRRVLIAGDFRTSTLELKSAAIAGLLDAGARVLDAGQIPTPIAYFAHAHWKTDAVLIVTASHNPAVYNGLKFMAGGLPPTTADLEHLRLSHTDRATAESPGFTELIDPVTPYLEWITGRWAGIAASKKLEVVLDAGSGAWGEIAPAVFEYLGYSVHRLCCTIDGTFPCRPPDCARAANLVKLREEVRRTGADLGIAWDGDGDRVAFVDESGRIVSADRISVVLCRRMLAASPGAGVAYDIKLSDCLRRAILDYGGLPQMERSGHAFLKRRVIEQHCVMGCEASGHFFYSELGGRDDGLFTALLMTDIVAREGPLGMLAARVPQMYVTPDLRLPAGRLDFDDVSSRLRIALATENVSTLDGIRIETADGFVLARPSVTEPVVTLRIEGFDRPGLQRLVGRCAEVLPEMASQISEQLAREDEI